MLKRLLGKLSLMLADAALVSVALLLAFSLARQMWMQGGMTPEEYSRQFGNYLWYLVLLSVVVRISIFAACRLYRWSWHYAGMDELYWLVLAVTLGSVTVVTIQYFIPFSPDGGQTYIYIPRSVTVIDWLLNIALIGGLRFSARFLRETHYMMATKVKKRILIVGAGQAGEMIAYDMLRHPQLGLQPVGFIDDDPAKANLTVHGIRVLGTSEDLGEIVKKRNIDEVLIAIPTSKQGAVRKIIGRCERAKVTFRIVPPLQDVVGGRLTVSQIRDVKVEDLLKRDEIDTDVESISAYLEGKRVLVTGAAGSIGSELCRQVCSFKPEMLICLDHNENGLYFLEHELRALPDAPEIVAAFGDIRERDRLKSIFEEYKPQVVFHAAAHKHVPMMELNPGEAIKNNVLGTLNVAEVAQEMGVERFVMISTDKAVNPTSVMGVSKRVAEKIIQSFAQKGGTIFVAVRFGNVLGSNGSVIPLFRKQIEAGGPVTVTHEEVTRFFMTISEAVQLVIQAAALGKGGEVFVLDIGEPIKIADLARDLIALSGFEPDVDIKIVYTGLRPGEKLYEELLTAEEGVEATKHKKIFVARLEDVDPERLRRDIDELAAMADAPPEEIRRKFREIVPTYQPRAHQAPHSV